MSSKTTQYGFKWEEDGIRLVVQRSFCDKKHMVLTVYTDRGCMDLWVTPTGFVRVGKTKKPGAKSRRGRIDREYLKGIMEQ